MPAAAVRALIAARLGPANRVAAQLGQISLRSHQIAAASRLLALIDKYGGALLADPVGLGKTYTALSVARALNGPTCVAAPAALRDMWTSAAASCEVEI